MSRNSSGTYTLPLPPVAPNTLIETTWANPTLADIAATLTASLDRNGSGNMLAPLLVPVGTASAPTLSFTSETTLGIFRPTAGALAIAVGSVARFTITATLLTITVPTTFSAAVTFNGGATLAGTVDIDKLLNATPAQSFGGTVPDWQMAAVSFAASSFGQSRFNNSAAAPASNYGHSRGATIGTFTILQLNDGMGTSSYWGSDGVKFVESARISANVDGAPALDDVPGRLTFYTKPTGAANPLAASLTLRANGNAEFAAGATVVGGTVSDTLDVTGAAWLKGYAQVGNAALLAPATKMLIDATSASVMPALLTGTVLTLARSSSANTGAVLQIISGNTSSAAIYLGDSDAPLRGGISYNHVSESMVFYTGGTLSLTIDSAGNITPVGNFNGDFVGNITGTVSLSNGTAAAPSLNFSSSLTTGLFRQSADVIGFATAGAERWRMNATGILASGGSIQATRVGATTVTPGLQVSASTLGGASSGNFMFSATAADAPYALFARSKSATIGTHAIVANSDAVGRLSFAASDGVKFVECARIMVGVDGTPGLDDMPGILSFLTTADGASSPTTVLSLRADNSANFTGVINGSTAVFTSASAPPQLTINRTGSTVNTILAYQNTSGTVYAGHAAALTFSISGTAAMTAPWAQFSAGAATVIGNLGVNGGTFGTLGVMEGTGYGGAGPNTNADTLVLDSSGNAGMSLLSPNTATSSIYFGDPESAIIGRITYAHPSDTMSFLAGGVSSLTITATAVTLAAGTDAVLSDTAPSNILSVGFRGIPQNSKSADYTLVLADAGKHIFHPAADTTARTWTIPANVSVAFPVGTAITFVNNNAAGVITIAITTDTMRLAGAGTTGSRTLAPNGIATAVKIISNAWIISGTNLT